MSRERDATVFDRAFARASSLDDYSVALVVGVEAVAIAYAAVSGREYAPFGVIVIVVLPLATLLWIVRSGASDLR